MVWPTLGSRTAKEQNRTVCVPRNNAGAAHWRAAEASAHNVAVSSVANPFVAVSLPAHLWMRWMHLHSALYRQFRCRATQLGSRRSRLRDDSFPPLICPGDDWYPSRGRLAAVYCIHRVK